MNFMNVKLMTYNIMHGLDFLKLKNKERFIDLDKIKDVIKEENPDIISLNEVYNDTKNIETVDQVKYLANNLGYTYYAFGQAITIKDEIEYGNGIMSKYPITNFKVHHIKDPINKDEPVFYETRVIMEMDILINKEVIKCFVTHFGLANDEQRNATDKLISLIKNLDNEKIILMGDFNMMEDNPYYNVISKYLDDSVDVIRGSKFTFSSVEPKEKIDYIFTKNINKEDAYVKHVIASDHFPYILNIKL